MTKDTTKELTAEEQKMLKLLKDEGRCHIKTISDALDKSAAGVVDLAQKLKEKKIYIWKSGDYFYLGSTTIELPPEDLVIKKKEIRIGFIADTIMGSKYEQPTALRKAFQIAEHEGVDFMIHLGVSAGKPTPSRRGEFHKSSVDDQIDYIVANYPKSNKFKVRLISGHHDMQWRKEGKEGINILAEVCRQREDLIYRGDLYSDFPLRRGVEKDAQWPILKAAYHGGDDTPYSKSYPVQGYAENLIQDVNDLFSDEKPDIVAVAGQGVWCDLSGGVIKNLFSLPGLRVASPSIMKKKRRSVVPTVGLVIITVKFYDGDGFFITKTCYPLPSFQNDYREKFSNNPELIKKLNKDGIEVLKFLEESPKSRGEIAQAIDKSDKTVVSIISSLQKIGISISDPDDPENPSKNYKLNFNSSRSNFEIEKIDFNDYFFSTLTEGAVSDTHFGHFSELIPILHEAYDVFEKRGIQNVNHGGDITNGSPKHEEHMKGEVREFRATPLTNDVIYKFPHRRGITTHAVMGDHDRWFLDQTGYNLLEVVSQVRPDIKNLGIQQGERSDGKFITIIRHFNWGTGYAKSYKPQQAVEGWLLKEISKEPKKYKGRVLIALSGGGHVFCAMLYKGIAFILLPCLQGKTGFISGLGKLSDMGFLIYSVTHNKEGFMTRFSVEYFDRVSEALALVRKGDALRERRQKIDLTNPIKKSKKSEVAEKPPKSDESLVEPNSKDSKSDSDKTNK